MSIGTAGGALAVLILALTDGASLPEALAAAKKILGPEPGYEETLRAIEMAEMLAVSGLPHEEALAQLGEWLEPLELREVITEFAQDLYDFREWNIGEFGDDEELQQRVWQKYPG